MAPRLSPKCLAISAKCQIEKPKDLSKKLCLEYECMNVWVPHDVKGKSSCTFAPWQVECECDRVNVLVSGLVDTLCVLLDGAKAVIKCRGGAIASEALGEF